MTFQDLGYNDALEEHRKNQGLADFEIGRVILEHKDRYIVLTPTQEYESELMGNLRFTAESKSDLPAVGDWVAFMEYDDGKGLIHAVFPRQSIMERKAVGKVSQTQIIATNIDCGLIVQAVDRDFNLNRLERYLIVCNSSKVKPVIILSKIDLIDDAELQSIISQIENRISDVTIICVSNAPNGYSELDDYIDAGKTYCLLGSSGVGKSTLLNGLQGKQEMKTAEISSAVNKGKHTTTHRELFVLKNGGILIDNPGMREIGITDSVSGLNMTFGSILGFANQCKYNDCSHTNEDGCAILEAVENGDIDAEAYANFRKMEKENAHFESDSQERKKKDKDFGKMIKNVKKHRKSNKY